MSGPSLDGVWTKFRRGESHIDAFDEEYVRLVGPLKKKEIVFEGEPEKDDGISRTVLYRLGELPNIKDSDCSVIVGDALNNFRAALDHLAWIMVKRKGTPFAQLKRTKKERIQFPLAKNRTSFPDAMKRNLPGITRDSDLGKLVASFQPYNRGKPAQAMRGLRDLTNRDKHRLLVFTTWHPQELGFYFEIDGWAVVDKEILLKVDRRPLKSGTPLVRATFARVSVNATYTRLKGKGSVLPVLSGSWAAGPLLEGVRETVRDVIEKAKPLL